MKMIVNRLLLAINCVIMDSKKEGVRKNDENRNENSECIYPR